MANNFRLFFTREGTVIRLPVNPEKLAEARAVLSPAAAQRLEALAANYSELLKRAERQSRRFRKRYAHMTSRRYTLDDVRAYGAEWKASLRRARAERKARRKK